MELARALNALPEREVFLVHEARELGAECWLSLAARVGAESVPLVGDEAV